MLTALPQQLWGMVTGIFGFLGQIPQAIGSLFGLGDKTLGEAGTLPGMTNPDVISRQEATEEQRQIALQNARAAEAKLAGETAAREPYGIETTESEPSSADGVSGDKVAATVGNDGVDDDSVTDESGEVAAGEEVSWEQRERERSEALRNGNVETWLDVDGQQMVTFNHPDGSTSEDSFGGVEDSWFYDRTGGLNKGHFGQRGLYQDVASSWAYDDFVASTSMANKVDHRVDENGEWTGGFVNKHINWGDYTDGTVAADISRGGGDVPTRFEKAIGMKELPRDPWFDHGNSTSLDYYIL
jgi:hypothetical protein